MLPERACCLKGYCSSSIWYAEKRQMRDSKALLSEAEGLAYEDSTITKYIIN